MKTISYCIQCTDQKSKTVGTFAYDEALYEQGKGFQAISPVFLGSGEFYRWAHSMGYKSERNYSFTMVRE